MPLSNPYSYGEIASAVQKLLIESAVLSYVPDAAIKVCGAGDKNIVPAFDSFLIRLFPPNSGFSIKTPKIGNYFNTTYIIAIELWIKSLSSTEQRLLSGNQNRKKGLYEFFKDVEGILEHNTLSNMLQPYAGSSIKSPVPLKSNERMIEGLGFLWYGNQNNL